MISEFRGPYRFLSNFWPAIVSLDGVFYPTVEHVYQAAKSSDIRYRKNILLCATPGDAKRLGSRAKLRPDWEEVKVQIMHNLVLQKFQQYNLRKLLLDTGDQYIQEGNNWGDRFWGVCNGVGENHLGKILMSVREHYAKI